MFATNFIKIQKIVLIKGVNFHGIFTGFNFPKLMKNKLDPTKISCHTVGSLWRKEILFLGMQKCSFLGFLGYNFMNQNMRKSSGLFRNFIICLYAEVWDKNYL